MEGSNLHGVSAFPAQKKILRKGLSTCYYIKGCVAVLNN